MLRGLPALLLSLALAAVLTFAACSDKGGGGGAETPGATATATETATAEPPSSTPQALSPTLREILAEVASVRGLDAPPALDVYLVARPQVPALLDSLLTDEDREWFRDTTTLYRLVGHLRDDQDYETVYKSFGGQSILGLYSPLDDALWVVHEEGETPDLDNLSSGQKETLVHEFVHAIQDYHFKLDEVYMRTVDDLDWGLTFTAAVEGDAMTHEALHTQKFGYRIGPGRVLLAAGTPNSLQDVPPTIARELLFPYTSGAQWIAGLLSSGGVQQVNDVVADPPRGTAYVLHPELLAAGFVPASVELPDLGAALGDGWERESGGQFGEFQLRNYLQLQIRGGDAARAAAGWQGDRYDVYVNGDESVAAFRIRFASEAEAAEFLDAQSGWFEDAPGAVSVEDDVTYYEAEDGDVTAVAPRAGTDVLFVIGSRRDVAEKALGALLNG